MTIRTQSHHPSPGAVIPSAGLESNFVELYDLQNGGIDGTNMNLNAVFAWNGAHSFGANVNFDSGLLCVDATNNRIYYGATATTTVDSLTFEHQHKIAGALTLGRVVISTATGSTGVREASWHNSASPAISDRIYEYKMYGNNNAAVIKQYGSILCITDGVTSGSESSHISTQVMVAGTLTSNLLVYADRVQVAPESLVVGTNTNIGPDGFAVGLYTVLSDSNRRVACFSSTDATASAAIFDIYKNSASPAASDVVTQLRFMGNDSAGNYQNYGDIRTTITDATSGSEDAEMSFRLVKNGTATEFLNADSNGDMFVEITNHLLISVNSSTTSSAAAFVNDNNSALDMFGITIDGSNAGAGDFSGIDLSSISSTDYTFEVVADTTSVATSTTNSSGRIRIKTSTGLSRFIPYFT